jgi:hypothetical protein
VVVWLTFFGGVKALKKCLFFTSQLQLPRSFFWHKPMPGIWQKLELHSKRKRQDQSQGLDSSFLIAAWPKSATATGTRQEIHEAMAWSFAALFQGLHPETDWKGRTLPAKLAKLARKPITPQKHCFWVFNFFR